MRRRLAGVSGRFSGLSQPRQCGDDVLRMLVTGGPPVRGGGGMPHRIMLNSPGVGVARHRGRIIRKHARHRCEVADVAIDDAEQRGDGGLVCGDRIEVARLRLQIDSVNLNS